MYISANFQTRQFSKWITQNDTESKEHRAPTVSLKSRLLWSTNYIQESALWARHIKFLKRRYFCLASSSRTVEAETVQDMKTFKPFRHEDKSSFTLTRLRAKLSQTESVLAGMPKAIPQSWYRFIDSCKGIHKWWRGSGKNEVRIGWTGKIIKLFIYTLLHNKIAWLSKLSAYIELVSLSVARRDRPQSSRRPLTISAIARLDDLQI